MALLTTKWLSSKKGFNLTEFTEARSKTLIHRKVEVWLVTTKASYLVTRSPTRVKRMPRHVDDLGPLRLLREPNIDSINDTSNVNNLMTISRSQSWDPRHQMTTVEVPMVC